MVKKAKSRNLHACHPIMRKGGVHQKSKSAERSRDRLKTKIKVRNYLSEGQEAPSDTSSKAI